MMLITYQNWLCLQDLYADSPTDALIHLVDEHDQNETTLAITMETKGSLGAIVNVIRDIWEHEFGVPLELNTVS